MAFYMSRTQNISFPLIPPCVTSRRPRDGQVLYLLWRQWCQVQGTEASRSLLSGGHARSRRGTALQPALTRFVSTPLPWWTWSRGVHINLSSFSLPGANTEVWSQQVHWERQRTIKQVLGSFITKIKDSFTEYELSAATHLHAGKGSFIQKAQNWAALH